tara:strand:- start:555 stop:1304 length:750 start_codon:yes stop_codon:yes gene_type:complete
MKPMDDALDDFLERLDEGEPFAISRWGDGEYRLLEMIPLERTPSQVASTNVWSFDPSNENERIAAKRITNSLSFESKGLYWGITCPSCSVCNIKGDKHYEMYEDKTHLTYASLFVNGNHEEVQRTLPQILKKKNVVFVGNANANVEQLHFDVSKHFKVGNNAWLHDYEIIQELKEYISNFEGKGLVFLFACGPLSNYLITEIWKENQDHFLLDIGSAFDVYLYNRVTRGFHGGRADTGYGKFCEWDNRK